MRKKVFTEEELQSLVVQAQGGDQEAFGHLYNHFFDQVYRYAAFRLPAEEAEDVVADVFVKSWENLHTYKPQKNIPFSSWLFRIARYTVIDSYRSRRTVEEVSEDLVDEDAFNAAESRLKRGYLLATVRKAMDQLPRRYRDILELSFMADLPHHEVARVLRMSEGSVRVLKFRALKKLEQFLPAEMQEKM